MRGAILGVSMLILWVAAFPVGCAPSQMTREQIEEQIAKELPLGSSRERVIAFLTAHHVENSSSSPAEPPDQVLAIYRDVKGSTFVIKKAVQVVFRFKDNALESYSFKEALTGP